MNTLSQISLNKKRTGKSINGIKLPIITLPLKDITGAATHNIPPNLSITSFILQAFNSFIFNKEICVPFLCLIFGPFLPFILTNPIVKFLQRYNTHMKQLSIEIEGTFFHSTILNFLLKRFIWFFIGLYLWYISFHILIVTLLDEDRIAYNWYKLNNSIEINGYNPEHFLFQHNKTELYKDIDGNIYTSTHNWKTDLKLSWFIKVIEDKDQFKIFDGNHRYNLLKKKYGEDYKVKVLIYEMSTYPEEVNAKRN